MKVRPVFLVLGGLILIVLTGCVLRQPQKSSSPEIVSSGSGVVGSKPAPKIVSSGSGVVGSKPAPKLESVLYDLFRTHDKLGFAKTRKLDISGDRVQVVLELNDVNYKLPPEFGAEETRSGNLLQAQVRMEKLLELTDDPAIKLIRTPDKPIPLQ